MTFDPRDPTSRVRETTPAGLKIWDPASGRELLSLIGHTRGITSIAFAPGGDRLASTGWDQTIRLWDGK